jgi:hypothetical protein
MGECCESESRDGNLISIMFIALIITLILSPYNLAFLQLSLAKCQAITAGVGAVMGNLLADLPILPMLGGEYWRMLQNLKVLSLLLRKMKRMKKTLIWWTMNLIWVSGFIIGNGFD